MDSVDKQILDILKQNSRLSFQDIGKKLFLTGQAVSARVHRMEELEIISGYTITQKNIEIYFITIYMKTNNFDAFEKFLKESNSVKEAYKTIGKGCYTIVVHKNEIENIDRFLEKCTDYGTYSVSTTVRTVK